ncbi:phage tail protein [Morganella morganii]
MKPFAKNGQKNVIPENYETSMESNQATWDQGFGQITMLPVAAGGLPPKGQDFNGIFNQISENIVYLSQGGRFKFSAEYAEAIGGYPKGSILQSDDEKKEYLSLIDNNKVDFNTASDISASWKLVNTDDLLAQIASKQPKGDYATKTELNSGLAGKQPAGDYATKTEVGLKLDKNAVVQNTGTSTTNVMSQKSVTDALANAVKDYLKLTGGTLTGQLMVKEDGAGIIVQPKKENGSCYIQARNPDDKAVWYIGRPTDGGTAIYFRNYLTDTEISLHQAGVNIKGRLSLSDYSNFDDRYGQPVGSVVFLLHGDTPAGRYIKANGAAISRTTYADLYAVLGLKYGSGNGSTTFNVPDLRGEFPRFWDDGRGVDSGRALGTAQGDAMRNLTGTLSRLYGESGGGTGVFRGVSVANSSKYLSGTWEGDRATEFNASNQVPTAGEFRPRNIALAAWIKY